ncbi:asparagine synthase (glutamine-hydrolysing) [Herbihabitans rhizosphaerae]|uniref:asparagine synthase (glutamine-hydrolyzing) n=2 Tax=Herbihabitans rhizosphaerae TaxID=1872711 RepID=A0A4Q7KW16_9PSEU|nr:asparagine synthase (glutamine-hydrolysing) [Herbihabitans rhizosphaerae]
MERRGPDEYGFWVGARAAFGHRRLSIIDLPGGKQPMTVETPDGPVVLTYSGETYNYVELRDELRRRGHEFTTSSDTEVVLHGYLEWGAAVAERLVGMCAIGIWDGRIERLTLIRDRLGVKPMHYREIAGGLLFGSEQKAILANPLVEPVVDADGMRELITMSGSANEAVWSGINIVRPGTVVTFDRGGLRTHTYWRLSPDEHRDDLPTTIERVREMTTSNVRHELVADVPRGMLLSGGLDSSTLTGLAVRELGGEKIKTFSVDFPGQDDDFGVDNVRLSADGPYVREVVEFLGTDHHHVVLDHAALSDPEVRAEVVSAWDTPRGFGDANASLYLLFRAVKEHVTVALSGEGADEIFMGHVWHAMPAVHAGEGFPWVIAWAHHESESYLDQSFAAELDFDGYIADRYRDSVTGTPLSDGESTARKREREIGYLGLTRWLRTLNNRMDRLAMRAGVETRVPFCDHRMAEYLYNVPYAMQRADGHEKSLLRAAAADVIPSGVRERRKSAYPSTQDPLYIAALQRQAREVLADNSSVTADMFDRAKLAKAIDVDPRRLPAGARSACEQLLDIDTWARIYRPALKLS